MSVIPEKQGSYQHLRGVVETRLRQHNQVEYPQVIPDRSLAFFHFFQPSTVVRSEARARPESPNTPIEEAKINFLLSGIFVILCIFFRASNRFELFKHWKEAFDLHGFSDAWV